MMNKGRALMTVKTTDTLFALDDALPLACQSCLGCTSPSIQRLSQPEMRLSAGEAWSGIWKAWLKPLCAVVATSLVCSMFEVPETQAIGMIVGAFFVVFV